MSDAVAGRLARDAPNEIQSFTATPTITKEEMQVFIDIMIDKDVGSRPPSTSSWS